MQDEVAKEEEAPQHEQPVCAPPHHRCCPSRQPHIRPNGPSRPRLRRPVVHTAQFNRGKRLRRIPHKLGRCEQPRRVIACERRLATPEVQADRHETGGDDRKGQLPQPVCEQGPSAQVIQQEHHPDEGQHLDFGHTPQKEEPQCRAILAPLAIGQKPVVCQYRREKTLP